MWNSEELAWAAGLFEGEGCFADSHGVPVCRLGMTDEDVIRRFHEIIRIGTIYAFTRTNPNTAGVEWKNGHEWATTNFEHTQAFMAAIWPWLGERRKAKAHDLLAGYGDQLPQGPVATGPLRASGSASAIPIFPPTNSGSTTGGSKPPCESGDGFCMGARDRSPHRGRRWPLRRMYRPQRQCGPSEGCYRLIQRKQG